MIGVYQDVARRTCVVTRELPDGRTEYVMQDGGRVDVFTMATKQFESAWREIEVSKPLHEIVRNMIALGESSSMSQRAKDSLEAMLPKAVQVPFEAITPVVAPPVVAIEPTKRTRRPRTEVPAVVAGSVKAANSAMDSLEAIKAWEEQETALIKSEMEGLASQVSIRKLLGEARQEAEARVASMRAELAQLRKDLGL